MNMIQRNISQKGFTLLELIAVMIILSVLAALAIPRYISLDAGAKERAIDAGISELNGRESLTWSNLKISVTGWENDANTFSIVDTYLGDEYTWTAAPTASGGILNFKNSSAVNLTRTESTYLQPGHWSR